MPRVARVVRFTAQPGRGEELARVFVTIAESLRDAAGCELYLINRVVGDDDVIWVNELWSNQGAVDASLAQLQSEEGKGRLAEVMSLLAGPPERTDLEPVGGIVAGR